MRAVIMAPGQQWPRIVHEDIPALHAILGGPSCVRSYRWRGCDLLIITNSLAEAGGASPNRIVDGRCLYGPIIVIGAGLTNLPLSIAKDLQSDCEWPPVQVEAYDRVKVKGNSMKQYRTCPICGAHLDPEEQCDCEKEATPS